MNRLGIVTRVNMKIFNLILILSLCFFFNCKAQSTKMRMMSSVSSEFITSLKIFDSIKAIKLFYPDKNQYELSASIKRDSKLINKITKYYKISVNNYLLNKEIVGENEFNVVIVKLIDRDDTTMNIKSAQLKIYFPPDKYFSKTVKIVSYSLKIISLNGEGEKLLKKIKKPR